jgi:uncharacterized membrane protein
MTDSDRGEPSPPIDPVAAGSLGLPAPSFLETTMNLTTKALLSAAALSALAAGAAIARDMTDPPPGQEKCYGVAKAGENDCATAANGCAGSAKADYEAGAWKNVPVGTCAKIVTPKGKGSLTPPMAMDPAKDKK